ncbi:MAG: hypothetical protein HZA53_19315 [Planctomycetes bacterium]|nr:hypothetical protein [Planctomycetota bacterium]
MARRSAESVRELAPAPRSRFELPRSHRGVLAEAERALAMEHARALLEAPTAPYAEDGPIAVVRAFAREHPELECTEDRHANVILRWPGTRHTKGPTLAYSAHLDHPGFLYAQKRRGAHEATFHGGVPGRYLPGARVRFFDCATRTARATACVETVRKLGDDYVCTLADVAGALGPGTFGMWDLTPGVVRGTRLHARVCDDLMGAAAILSTLAWCVRTRQSTPVVGIFTRAEETGFVGCLGLLRERGLLDGLAVVGLECSPRRATAKVGHGPVVRVGDKQSVFVPWITERLHAAAIDLHYVHNPFVFQRALMDGGSCESTAYNAFGVEAGALCLALGNYHNCGPKDRIAPEFVDWNDHEGLIALMLSVVREWNAPLESKMLPRLNRNWSGEYNRLAASARRIRAGVVSRRTRKRSP